MSLRSTLLDLADHLDSWRTPPTAPPPQSGTEDLRPLVLVCLPFVTWGGPGSLLGVLLRSMTRYRVLVALPPGGEGSEVFTAAGARVVEVPGLETLPRETHPLRLARRLGSQGPAVARLTRLIQRERPVLVHSFTEGMLQGALAARLTGLPSVTHTIGMTIFRPRPVGLAMSHVLDRSNDLLLCAQPMIRNEYLAFGARPERLVVLPNCIEPQQVVARAAGHAPDPAAPPLLTMVAQMDRRKGHDFLLRAAALLVGRGMPIRVRVIGCLTNDPGFHAELQELVRTLDLGGIVEFVGASREVPAHLAEGTIHVVPSRIEALPLAGLEAMALGKPVVATRVGGNAFLVDQGQTGLLARAEDPVDLADQIAALLADPARARAMGEAGRQRVAEGFDAAAVVPRLEAIYDRLTGRS